MKRPASNAGFTLIEVIITMTVIAVLAAMAAPSISTAMDRQRQANAAREVVRFLRDVRGATRRTGVAHTVHIQADASEMGLMLAYMGMNNRCDQVDWEYAISTSKRADVPLLRFDMAWFNSNAAAVPGSDAALVMRLQQVPYRNYTDPSDWTVNNPTVGGVMADGYLCFSPRGEVYFGDTFGNMQPLGVSVLQFSVQRWLSGSSTGVGRDRHVVLSPSGVPRIRR